MLYRLLDLLIRKYYSFSNKRYFRYSGIHPTVKFATDYPGCVRIIMPHQITIGEHSVINADSVIHCSGKVSIGSYVHIGRGLTIYSSNHNYLSNRGIPYDDAFITKPVIIGDFVWIGADVSIIPGITVGEGAIVGMGAVVTKDVPPGDIVGGNPAQKIGSRDMQLFNKLKLEKKFF